jgi:SRSO17 transposase
VLIRVGAIEKAQTRPMFLLENNNVDPEGRVMIIDRRPACLQAFFDPFRSRVSRPQFAHLWSLLLAWVANVQRSVVWQLAARLPEGVHRTSHGRFLTQADWDAAGLLNEAVLGELRRMRPSRGEAIYLILDDHRIAKRGRKMFGLSKIWDHKGQRFVYGHIVVTAAILFRGVIFPWRFELWLPKACAGRAYRKTTQIAAEIIAVFQPPAGLKVRVLFDAFYLSPTVTKACESKGFSWFSVASRNRWFTQTSGVDQKIADLGPGLLKYRGHRVRMPRSRGTRKLRIVDVVGSLAKIGHVKLVFSKRPQDPWKHLVAFATSETKLDARAIVSIYERRWRIEVLFKELEGDLGLGDYQVLTHRGIVHHLHVCGLVHLMLTHHGMDAVGAQARKAKTEVALPSLSRRLETLRAALKRDQLERILRHEHDPQLRRKIETYLLAA